MIIHIKMLLNHPHSNTWIIISKYLRNDSNSIHRYDLLTGYWFMYTTHFNRWYHSYQLKVIIIMQKEF